MEYVTYDNTDITDDIKQPNENILYNSYFQIWQRGTSITPSNANKYTADRWRVRGTVDGTITYSKYEDYNGMKIVTTNNQISQVEQIVELNDRTINFLVNKGVSSQLRFDRSGDTGPTTLIISILDSSQQTLIEKKSSTNSNGLSNPKTLTVIFTPEEILEYEDTMKYITFRVVNSLMLTSTNLVLHWAKMEYGIFPTSYNYNKFSYDFTCCEYFYAKRGINIRMDANSTDNYIYTIPFSNSRTESPTITIASVSGDVDPSRVTASYDLNTRKITVNFYLKSTGNRKQVFISLNIDFEIY